MDLPIDNEELKELMDALNESNHPDAMKRQFRMVRRLSFAI